MTFKQLMSPNLGVKVGAGLCHKLVQDSFGVPRMYGSATEAANATKYRHTSRAMPDVAVPVWLDHWGSYGPPGREVFGNWGHVVDWVPGKGFFSSPHSGFGNIWYSTLEQVERAFNAKYRFWSEDMHGQRIVQPITQPTPSGQEEEDDMAEAVYVQDAATKGQGSVYRLLANGRKRLIPTPEWNGIRAQESAASKAGYPAPVIVGQMSGTDLAKIPNA